MESEKKTKKDLMDGVEKCNTVSYCHWIDLSEYSTHLNLIS
jgi:hypothetical protein